MKRLLGNIAIVLITVFGVGLLVYPYVNYWVTNQRQSYVIQQYDDNLAQMDEAMREAEWQRTEEYNATLSFDAIPDPFAEELSAQNSAYSERLNVDGNGMMASVKIPKIKVDTPIFHGTAESVLQKGIGHLEGSSLPVGGLGTHSVITGHSGLNNAKMFTDLPELSLGDEFYIYVLGDVLAYKIDNITVVEPSDVRALRPQSGKDQMTLITCTPYGINSHRLLVRGERVPYTPQEIEQRIADTNPVMDRETLLFIFGVSFLALLVLLCVVLALLRKRRNKRRQTRGPVRKN